MWSAFKMGPFPAERRSVVMRVDGVDQLLAARPFIRSVYMCLYEAAMTRPHPHFLWCAQPADEVRLTVVPSAVGTRVGGQLELSHRRCDAVLAQRTVTVADLNDCMLTAALSVGIWSNTTLTIL
jgi:hypothetical protein